MAKPTRPAESAAFPEFADDSPSEHIYIGGDEFSTEPKAAARTVRAKIKLHNGMRHADDEMTLFAEGFMQVTSTRRNKRRERFLLDLRFIDPIPQIEHVIAKRSLYVALGCAATAALAGFLMRFEALYLFAAPVLGAAAVATAVATYLAVYRSYEITEFRTLHGRAVVLQLLANLGSIKRFRAFVPVLNQAIEEASETITSSDAAAFLRAEMREHYRLRGDGVLDHDTCAAGTGRILAQFDGGL